MLSQFARHPIFNWKKKIFPALTGIRTWTLHCPIFQVSTTWANSAQSITLNGTFLQLSSFHRATVIARANGPAGHTVWLVPNRLFKDSYNLSSQLTSSQRPELRPCEEVEGGDDHSADAQSHHDGQVDHLTEDWRGCFIIWRSQVTGVQVSIAENWLRTSFSRNNFCLWGQTI